MIQIQITSKDDREDQYDINLSISSLEGATVSELETLAAVIVAQKLTRIEEGFLTPEQYDRFKTEVQAQFDAVIKKIHQAYAGRYLNDRRN